MIINTQISRIIIGTLVNDLIIVILNLERLNESNVSEF